MTVRLYGEGTVRPNGNMQKSGPRPSLAAEGLALMLAALRGVMGVGGLGGVEKGD